MRSGPIAFVLAVLGIAVGGVVLALTAPVTTTTSVAGAVPERLDVAATGDPTCGGMGLPFTSDVIAVEDGRLASAPPPGVALTVDPGGRSVAWAAAFPLERVVVGAGGRLHVYAHDPPTTRDAGLAAPRDGGGLPVRIDRVVVCWGADGVEVAWCPPTFWAATVTGSAWAATDIDPDDRSSSSTTLPPPVTRCRSSGTAIPTLTRP